MKIKKEYIILAVIIAALLLYLSQRSTDRTLYQLPDVPEISVDSEIFPTTFVKQYLYGFGKSEVM